MLIHFSSHGHKNQGRLPGLLGTVTDILVRVVEVANPHQKCGFVETYLIYYPCQPLDPSLCNNEFSSIISHIYIHHMYMYIYICIYIYIHTHIYPYPYNTYIYIYLPNMYKFSPSRWGSVCRAAAGRCRYLETPQLEALRPLITGFQAAGFQLIRWVELPSAT
jgi:hypothetical protein